MHLPRLQFSLGRLMIAVAVAGVACWAMVVPSNVIRMMLVYCLGPLAGACWARLIALKPFDPGTRPELRYWDSDPITPSRDRFLQTIRGGLQGGAVGAVIITVVGAILFGSQSVLLFKLYSPMFLILCWLIGILACLMFSLLAGFLVGILVGLLAEAATWAATGRNAKA